MDTPPIRSGTPDPTAETRVRGILGGVVRETLRRSGRGGVAVVGGGPEASLLLRWFLAEGIPTELPSAELLEAARALLAQASPTIRAFPRQDRHPHPPDSVGSPGHGPGCIATAGPEGPKASFLETGSRILAGWALALARDLLPVGTETKTLLVLGEYRSGAPLLPLGDLYASQVAPFAGGCTAPGFLEPGDWPLLPRLDRALQALLEEGAVPEEAWEDLPPRLRSSGAAALEHGRNRWNPRVLVPKLGSATLGVDLYL